MATEIGTVTVLIGSATAVSTDGSIRHLQVGDKVFQNDLISTAADGAVEIHFADGSVMDLGRSSNALLDTEVFDPMAASADQLAETVVDDDIDLIQQAILEGADPTQIAEATAAGAGPDSGSEGTREPFYNDYNAPETIPDNGFDTTGISFNFFDPEPTAGLLDTGADAIFPPVDGEDPDGPPPNTPPQAASSNVITCEDTQHTFQLGDFRFSDADGDTLQFIRIDSLPLDGQLFFNGELITEPGLEISAEDIENGLLTFMPEENASGRDEYSDDDGTGNMKSDYATFLFSVSDGTDWSDESSTMTIDVSPVADAPELSVTSKELKTVTINKDNVKDTSGSYTVKAVAADGSVADISTRSGSTVAGFGVAGATSGGANQGHPDEIGYDFNLESSEQIIVEFVNDVTTVDVSFAWKHGYNYNSVTGSGQIVGETAVISFYKDGVFIESIEHTGGTDTIDGPFTFQPSSGAVFNEIRFSAKGEGDDYLINQITYTELVDSGEQITVEAGESILLSISAALTDTDGSESITKIVVGNIPAGFVLTDGVNIFTATDDLNEVDVKDWDLSSLSLQVPANAVYETTEFQLTVSATSEESLAGSIDPSENCGPLTATTEVPVSITVTAAPMIEIIGTPLADVLIGTEANEIIYGGPGNDVMTGGGGRDIFRWESGDEGTSFIRPATDTITDFNNGARDVLDISDLLQGEEAGNLTDYINIEQVGDDVVLNLSPNGDGSVTQIIKLQGTTLDDLGVGHFDPATQQADIINTLVSEGQIQVDQS